MALTSTIAVEAMIDWGNDGAYAGTDDVSAYARYPFTTRRGRASVNDEFGAGECRLRLRNNDGRFNPLYASSPLYPNVVPGRPLRARATYNAVTYDLFQGRCAPGALTFDVDAEAEFTAYDAFEQWRLGRTNTAPQTSKRVDQIIGTILDDISWPAGDRTLDTARETLDIFTNHNRLPLNALQMAARQEMEGGFWVGKNGYAVFRNRDYRSNQAALLTLTGIDGLAAELRQEDLADQVRVAYTTITQDVATTVIYTGPGSRKLAAGATTTWEVEFNGVGAASTTTPAIATDLIGNDQPDGSGTNKNAQLSVASWTPYSGGGVLAVANADSSPVYLTTEQVRGIALIAGEAYVTATVASPLVAGQRVTRTLEFMQSQDKASWFASWLAHVRGTWQPRVTVDIVPDTDALMVTVLNAELWNRVTLADTGATWLSQISGDYIIEAIDLQILSPTFVRARWTLFSKDLSTASFFRISGAAGGGADYSVLGAATGAADRISW